ncbi:Hypothetical protein P9303_03651 [Prochlorococcus marinus str. MIT 9303]|uniref:Uncharacterized protein n=1 Tax=Prochlorococcus marinus (strain MIT 9303) TaxID=59922 RepID=A2C6K7_PROM3|nr:Hypothetical protein P9303_03651 [Prochlorococcus marinus str. MIT 9303]
MPNKKKKISYRLEVDPLDSAQRKRYLKELNCSQVPAGYSAPRSKQSKQKADLMQQPY